MATFLRAGKTKDVYKLDDGNILLKFKDTVTGHPDGEKDPGGNSVVGTVDGVGMSALKMTSYYFEILKKLNIPTHYVSSDLSAKEMVVRPAEMFGKGLEFVCRFKAFGSFVKRFGDYCKEGDLLPAVVEVTLKDDERNDPPATGEIIAALGLLTVEEYNECEMLCKKICTIVKDDMAKRGIELVDIKVEFGKVDGKITLIDEISGGNMRTYKDGKKLDYLELSQLVCSK